ncbi:MAG: hypothetical protein P4L73_19200 [Caulobacteraceae bacterium]|nr:hypothetical protein [Caulobacteraceae bacterium]
MAAPAETVSKGEFARLRGVSAGRVSQWIAEGKITAAALEGEGRFAKIRVGVATAQLRDSLDIGQMLGNGITTRLDDAATDEGLADPSRVSPLPPRNPLDESIRKAKLEQLQRTNRQAEREELAERGIYTPTADARAAMVGLAATMLTTFEGALADLAGAVAAQFQIPQRDVLHLLRTEFRPIRAKVAEAARRQARDMADVVQHEPDAEDAQAA